MTSSDSYYRPLTLPRNRMQRVGHYLLIAMMLPMLLVYGIYGFVFGSYRRALKRAAVAREHDPALAGKDPR